MSVEHWLETGPVAHTLLGGVEAFYQRLRLDEASVIGDQDEHFFTPSLYLRNESDLTSWLTLALGARSRFHSEFDTKVLPNVGVLISPIESLRLRVSWGRSHRTPSLRELYQPPTAQLGGAYFLAGNPNLEPEESSSVRAGFEWTPARWLRLAGVGFYNDIDDHIRSTPVGAIPTGFEEQLFDPVFSAELAAICEAQARFFPDPADWTPDCVAYFSGAPVALLVPTFGTLYVKENLDSVQTYGIEAQLRMQLSAYASLDLDYTWLRTNVSDPSVQIDELPNEAEHAASARAVLTSPWYGTQLTTALRYRSGVIPERSGTGLITFADGSDLTDPSYQLDFRLVQPLVQPWFGELRIYVDALNVTDERREDSYAIRGRSFVAGVSGTFESPL
jgi:outer membrane receptor protein involved in Fe transport